MTVKKVKYELIDYVFWFLFILMTNPGGIFKAFGEDTSKAGGIDIRDFLFVLLFGCFMLISYREKIKHKAYKKITKYLIIFGLYYLIVFGYFVPTFKETEGYTLFAFLKKSRKTIYSLLLFVIVYRFYLRSYVLFYKSLILSSIIILALFFITVVTGIEILPTTLHNRGFIDIDRIFLASEGLMALLIPLGVVVIVFKSEIKWRKLILVAFLMMFLSYILSITRRDIIGVIVYFLIALVLHNYILRKPLIPVKKMLSTSVYLIVFGFIISFSFPKYADAGLIGLEEAVNVVNEGETSNGKQDVRMGFGKEFMQNLILDNLWFGTGFDNRWRGSGDKLGYETSDYPFLSAIAMTGIFGILVFLPVYIVLVRLLVYDFKFIRNKRVNLRSFEFCIFMVYVIYFFYNLLQYMNWFSPVSLSRGFKWYVILALYLASREIFYKTRSINQNNLTKSQNY